ncbi:MAG TPA: DUF2167 domain-containing protein [Gemmatimonadaceae bacterium]|nr:DUF2167 domain-containing protein [Gemmatimonadaceae bacterium]
MRLASFASILTLPLLAAALPAQQLDSAAYVDSLRRMESRLEWQTGKVELKDGLATVDVPQGWRFLGPEGAATVVYDMWGNQRVGDGPLGMLFPAEISPSDPSGWGVVITFDEDGYVKDGEAAKIDYTKLLKDMQKATRAANEDRAEAGYPPVELVGWAATPHYDKATNKLYWAKALRVGDDPEGTLNYDIRALGRRGVLSMNAVSGMANLTTVETRMTEVLDMVQFNDGHRYADFAPSTDKVAAYGIGALIAGKLAVKAGFFKLILAGLLAAKKLVIVAFVAIVGFVKKLFGKKDAPARA